MRRILIVEDDSDMLELLSIVFRESGYDVTFSAIALDLDDIRVLRPDLVILDVRLKSPQRSGAHICKELKSSQDTQIIPVILVSGEYNLAELAKECSADMFLAKPYDMRNLLVAVERYLS
jgi:two-component system response regulator VicR